MKSPYFLLIILSIYGLILFNFRKRKMHYRDIIQLSLPEKESEEFAEWAFGENFKELNQLDSVREWNKRHAKKLRISPGSKPLEDIPKMIEVWRNENKST